MTPRPYQQASIDAVENGWQEASRQLLVLPTGGGKTCVFSWLAQRRQPERTLILAHREELIDQAIAKLHSATGIVAEKEKAEHKASLAAPVVVASVQTMIRRLDKWPQDHFSLVVADEAHHAISPSWRKVLNHFDGHADVLGVTATPNRADARNLGEYFERIAHEVSLFELINDGYLSPISVKCLPVQIDLRAVKQVAGDFDENGLADAITPHFEAIIAAIKEHASFRRCLVFLPLVATSKKFVEMCNDRGLTAGHIDGETQNRKEVLAQFANGEFDLLSNAMLLTEGFDVDSAPTGIGIDCLIVLRPTKSGALFSQMVGRGTRTAAFKEDLLLLDFLWLHQKHQVCRPACLIARTDAEAEAITALTEAKAALPKAVADQMPLDLQNLASEAQAKREASLKAKLEEQKNRKAKTISAEEFAIKHNDFAAAEYEPTMKWEAEPITEKQAKYLKKAGIDLETVKGKGHATKLLALHFGGQPLLMAAPKAIALMSRMRHICAAIGITSPEHATQAEAGRFFAELNRRKKQQ